MRIKDYESSNFEQICLGLKEENTKIKWELEHAKRNLINYITSVKQLELANE